MGPSTAVTPDRPFDGVLAELADRGQPVDALLLAVPVVAMLLAFQLPPQVRQVATFSHSAPTVVAAYTTHYVHGSMPHLVGNLGIYLTVVPNAYVLGVLAGRRTAFLMTFLTVLGVFPFVLSASSLLVLGEGVLLGFSGVAMALVGLLPVVTTEYLETRFGGAFGLACSPALFFFGLVVIAVRAVPPTLLRPVIAVVAAGAGLLYLQASLRALGARHRRRLLAALDRIGYVEAAVLALVVFFLVLFAAFPPSPIGPGWVVNVYVHFLGYALGFIAPYLTYRIDRLSAVGTP